MYKLAAIDIDDTLLDSNGKISPGTKSALAKAAERGVIITLATGRMFASAAAVAEELGLDVPLITYQGSLIKHAGSGQVLYERHLPSDAAQRIFEYCEEAGLHLQAYVNDRLYVREDNEKTRLYCSISKIPFTVEPDFASLIKLPQTKLLIIDDPDMLDPILEHFANLFGRDVVVTKSKPNFLEFTHPEGTKGHALRHLATHYGFTVDKTIAIGDSWNDRDMIETAGLGVAMGNAVPSLKQIAGYVAPTNDEEGVRHVIERFLLQDAGRMADIRN
jgi:hypothetical protein